MKSTFTLNKHTKHRELVLIPQRSEVLNPRQASWIKSNPSPVYLHMQYEMSRVGTDCVLTYDVDGLVSIKRYLRRAVFNAISYTSMLVDIATVYGTCTFGRDRQFWQQALVFDPKMVFVNANERLRFVFVPLDGMQFSPYSSPMSLLKLLSDTKKLRFEMPNDYALAESLASYVFSERDTFSFNSFRTFIKEECGVLINPDGSTESAARNNMVGDVGRAERLTGLDVELEDNGTIPKTRMLGQLIGRSQNQSHRRISSEHNEAQDNGIRYRLVRHVTHESFPVCVGETIILGRGSKCRPQLLGNRMLSRVHVQLELRPNEVVITDLGSANGTYVLGKELRPNTSVVIQLGQRFSLAQEDFTIVCDNATSK